MSTFAVYGKSGTELFDHTYTYTHIDTLALIGKPLAGKASALQAKDAVERLRLRPGRLALWQQQHSHCQAHTEWQCSLQLRQPVLSLSAAGARGAGDYQCQHQQCALQDGGKSAAAAASTVALIAHIKQWLSAASSQ